MAAPQGDENMEDVLEDDEELQMALLASLAEVQPGGQAAPQQQAAPPPTSASVAPSAASGSGVGAQQLLQALQGAMSAAAAPAPAPPPPQQPAPTTAGGLPALNAQQLLQALHGAMAAAAGGAAAQPPPPPAGLPPAAQQQAAQPAAAPPSRQASDRHVSTPRPTVPRPDWAAPADTWAAFPPPPDSAILSSAQACAEGSAVQQACCKVFGQAVSLGPGSGGGGGTTTLHLPLAPAGPGGSLCLTAAAADAALARLPASGGVLDLQAAWVRAAEAATAPECEEAEASAVLHLLRARLARRAAGVLANDADDDLFFTGGKHRSALHRALESGGVAPAFLDAMVSCAASPAETALWEGVLRDSFAALSSFSFLDPQKSEGAWKRLDVVTQCPGMKRCLAALLVREATSAAGARGSDVAARSLLSPLLGLTALPSWGPRLLPLTFPARDCFMQLRGYPRNRGTHVESEYASIRVSLRRAAAAAHEILRRVATLRGSDGPLRGKEVLPAWVAAVAGANAARAEAGSYIDRVLSHRTATFYSAPDGFMLGTLGVCLRFCRPFLAGAEKQQGALPLLDPLFTAKQPHRVAGGTRQRSLAGTMMAAPPQGVFPFLSPDRLETEAPHFVAECFFMTQRMFHVGLLPAVHRYQALSKMLKQAAGDTDEDEPLETSASSLDQWLLYDSMQAQMLDPDFASDTVRFVELQARWLLSLMERGGQAAKYAFAAIPESVVRDMAAWLSFLIYGGATDLLGGADIGVLVACLTALLQRTDLVTSPPVHASIVQLLLAMLSPQLDYRRMAHGGALGPRRVTPAEAALVTAVLGTGAAQRELLPALMAAYAHADHVEGLDVDRDQYDKFHLRGCIDALLMELWRDPTCCASLTAVARAAAGAPGGGLFADFVGAVLNDLLYLLKDSLQRLEDIHALEVSKADRQRWEAVPQREREEKQAFYESQQGTTRGFMRMAVSTLAMLNTLVENEAVRQGFTQEAVVARAAAAAVHFVEVLVGPRCAELEVRDPGQYHFNPDSLLLSMVTFTARLAEQPAFVRALSAVPDYDESIIQRAVDVLATKQLGEYEHRRRLEALAAAVRQVRGEGPSSLDAAGGTAAALDLSFAEEEPADLEAAYAAAMEGLAVGDFDATAPRAYNRSFAAKAERQEGSTQAKLKALSKEVRGFSGRTRLPIYAASSILIRHDASRLDKMRALITGPEDTPYYGGAFIFDVYFPDDYPAVPPLMELETTGGGVARFNPNLYADGKVCLSLLGTWHGGHESEKWRPGHSNLFQVLLSIQGMIFISDPYFNEPAYEGMRGTSEGASSSLKYNSEIWLNNIRYAMVDQLRRPRPGFEEATRSHFRLLRCRIMRQCAAWLEAARPLDPLFQRRLRDAVAELHGLLAAL